MLQDFPKLKEKFMKKVLLSFCREREAVYLGVLSHIREKPLHEGNRTIFLQESGAQDKMKPREIASDLMDIKLDQVKIMTPQDIFTLLDKAAEETAKQKFKMIIDKTSQAAENVGNVVDLKGKPFTIEKFFDMLDRLHIDFDDNANPIFQDFLLGEKTFNSVSKVLSKLETHPDIKKRFAEIIERKSEEWRARESNRKLVG